MFALPRVSQYPAVANVFAVMFALAGVTGNALLSPFFVAQGVAQESVVAGVSAPETPPAPVTPAVTPPAPNLTDLTNSVFNAPRYAVVLGINNYADDEINDLELCENDAQAVYNLLIDPAIGGVPKTNATLLLGEQATATGIRRSLSPLGNIPQRSVVFVYYSGHGMKQADEAFWVTQDANKDDLAGTALSDTDIQRYLKRIPSDRVIVMIDACYAAATAKGSKAVDVSASLKKFTGKGRAILSAAGDGEEAIEAADLKHSVFTYYLLQGLRGAADTNQDGVLVLPEVMNYLDQEVADAARQRKGGQRPVVDLEGVQEPAKFSVVIDAARLQAIASATVEAQQLREARKTFLYNLALNNGLTVEQFKTGERLLATDPTKLSKLESSLLEIYVKVADQKIAADKLAKAIELAGASTSSPTTSTVTVPPKAKPTRKVARVNSSQPHPNPGLPTTPAPTPAAPDLAPAKIKLAGSKAGERLELTALKTPFRWCPPGTFTMGTPGATDDEAPVSVTLSTGYWLGETEVTQAQWSAVMNTTPREFLSREGADYPVVGVSWDDVIEYCNKLSEQERSDGRLPDGWEYTLPTEAQWEYACRAGTKTKYSFGDSESRLSDYAWWGGVEGVGSAKSEPFPHRVGLKQANAWGFRDMHGNVWEWCADSYDGKLVGGRDPVVVNAGLLRVRRGGCWNLDASNCRSALRSPCASIFHVFNQGFRIALVPASK